jgi:hypothetical protein
LETYGCLEGRGVATEAAKVATAVPKEVEVAVEAATGAVVEAALVAGARSADRR